MAVQHNRLDVERNERLSKIGILIRNAARFRLMLVLAAVALIGGVFLAMNGGAEARLKLSTAEVFVFGDSENFKGGSWLLRENNHLEMGIGTTGLEPGTAHNVWWVIYNKPQNCNEDGCNLNDFPPVVDGVRQVEQNPAEISLVWATGGVVGDDGTANFGARLLRRFSPGEVVFGPGLTDPQGAEIHLAVRSHGEVLPGEIAAQLSSFDLGCNPECAMVQVAFHKP